MYKPSAYLLAVTLLSALAAAPGCSKTPSGDRVALELEYEAIDLQAGSQKQVKIQSGMVQSLEVDRGSGLAARIDGDILTVSAATNAKKGKHVVTVQDGRAKTAVLVVNVAAVPFTNRRM